jgi:putative phosphoribosyl transferase
MASFFRDRTDAGRRLATALATRQDLGDDPIVLALPRGGVPVAFEVARALGLPLDVFLVRKLGVPHREEYAMGAIASGGIRVLNEEVIRALRIPGDVVEEVARREQQELERRERAYRGDRTKPNLAGRTAIIVDDGLATGATMRAAIRAARAERAGKVVVAVPTASPEICASLKDSADDVFCLTTPSPYMAVGVWYDDFSQTTDEEVVELLKRADAELLEHGPSTR